MPIDPKRFTRVQPVKAGLGQGQNQGPRANDRKVAALLRDLEEDKLEEPLDLLGSGLGAGGEPDGVEEDGRVPGERIRLKTSTEPVKDVILGLDAEGGFWIQSDANNTGEPVFRVFAGNSQILTLMRRAIGDVLLWPYLLIGDVSGDTTTPSSPLHVAGPIGWDYRDNDNGANFEQYWGTEVCDAAGGALNLTLPPIADVPGRVYVAKRINSGANAVVISCDGAETIDGAATKTLGSQYAAIGVQAGSTEWHLLWTMGTVT